MGSLDDLGADHNSTGDTSINTRFFGNLSFHFFFQTVFYLFLGAWVLGLDLLLGSPYSLDQLFSYKVDRHFLSGCFALILSGTGWEPCRGKTPHSWIHL